MTKKPFLLCILDGWGIGDLSNPNNAIAQAKTPNYDRFLTKYSNSQIKTSGLDVGLPDGQIGNSEVGHMTIGAGRVVFQDLPRINNEIIDNSLAKNNDLQTLIESLKRSGKSCHLAGLFSDGGVHSHIDHIIFLANLLQKNNIKTYLHLFLDGRDVAQKSALGFIESISDLLANKNIEIATISGRYFAMDRDQNWDRINLASDAILKADGKKFSDAQSVIKSSYKNNISDEFIEPCVIANYSGVEQGDGLIFCNFRADRARQISLKLQESKKFGLALAMTEYSSNLNLFYKILFPSIIIKNALPEILAKNNLKQLRIAETEKYAHVTFFFSCGKEDELEGEERILVKSPNVATYDLQPEMSASKVTENLVSAISSDKFDFIVVNYANPDMVGHSGMFNPAIKACEFIDNQLGILEQAILQNNGQMLITADHGNIEDMKDENNNPHTSHTTNPVPLILVQQNSDIKLKNGSLADLAPTIIELMNLEKPKEMLAQSLIENKS